MPLLVVEKGQDKGKSIPVLEGKTVLIGRDSSTALPLRDTMTSRMHFKLEAREDGYYLHDLESMNGTYLNGSRVRGEPVRLTFGDLIKAGETFFTFQSDETSATTLGGERMGGYRIIERIGRGGMGTVYKAEQIDLQRLVALKVISEEHTKDKDYLDLFVHEARAAAKLNHPNIVQVYDVKRHGDLYYFSMEYVSGGSVQDVLNKTKKMTVEQTVQMILDAARGLDYAHKKGIIHRDVKPDNFMISETGAIKIGDMGLARGLNEKVGPEEETSVIGTPHYIAPEQVLGRPADFRCDIYSLGSTMYRMLSGVTPFTAASVRDLVNRKVREEAPPVTEHAPEVPKALAEILGRMTARDPERRYQTMGEVVAALERFQRGQTGTGEIRREHSTAIQTIVQNKKLLAGTAAVLLLALIGAGWAISGIFRDNPKPPPTRDTPPNLELAESMLESAKLGERSLKDRSDPRILEQYVAEYDAVVAKFPKTPVAAKAAELRDALKKEVRQVRASQRLRLAEAEDKKDWQKFVSSFQTKKPDLAPVDEALAAYRKIAKDDETKETPAAEQAAARADHIQKWRKLFEDYRVEFEKVKNERVKALLEFKHWRTAQEMYRGFEQFCRKAEPECEFARDRWKDLFYDEAAGKEAEAVTAEARMAWTKIEQDGVALVRDRNYEAAIKLLDDVLKETVEEVAKDVRTRKEAWQSDWDNIVRMEREEAEDRAAKELVRARAVFGDDSAAAHKLFKEFDFKGALLKIRTLRDSNKADELKSRLDRRVMELERAVHFKDSLITVIKSRGESGVNPARFKRDYVSDGLEVTIEDADDKSLKFALANGQGSIERKWSQQFDGAAFVAFVKKQWKYSAAQNGDLNDRCDFAAVCMEFGLYEEALKEITETLAETLKNPASQPTDPVRKFCEEYGARLPKGESAEFSEVEAQKRLDRLEGFMKAAAYAEARAEIDLLRGRYYGRTQAVLKANSRIDECLLEIAKKGGEQLLKAGKEQKYQKMLDRMSEEQGLLKKGQVDIVARLNKIDDAFQRNIHLGSVYAAVGDLKASTERYLEAKRIGDTTLRRESWPTLGIAYAELFRNAILSKDKPRAQAIKNEASSRFVDPDNKTAEEKWWVDLRKTLEDWSENTFPQEEKRVTRLRDEVRASPDDPQRHWALAVCLMDSLGNLFEARGLFAYIQDNHHDFPQVANGNCLYRLAEIHFAAREIPQAIKRYTELQQQYKDNPKVMDGNSSSGVRRRLEDCYRLLNRMGYARDKSGK